MSVDHSLEHVQRQKLPMVRWTPARTFLTVANGLFFIFLFVSATALQWQVKTAFLSALFIVGGFITILGHWLEMRLEIILNGLDTRQAATNAVDHLLSVGQVNDIAVLWRETLTTIFRPSQISEVMEPLTRAHLKNRYRTLLVPGVHGHGFRLTHPKRFLRRFTWRDVELAQDLWEIFSQVQRSLAEFSDGQSSERHYLAEQVRSDLEWPLQKAMQEPDAAPYFALFERTRGELWDVREALVGESMTCDQLFIAIEVECRQRFSETGIIFDSSQTIDDRVIHIDAIKTISIRRILREAVTNVIRHASAKFVSLRMSLDDSGHALSVTLLDDGVGFDVLDHDAGHGLANMRRRASEMGASIEWCKLLPAGVSVSLRLSLSPEKGA